MEKNVEKSLVNNTKDFVITYKAPLLVFGILAAAVLFDYIFRSSDTDYYARGLQDMRENKTDAAMKDFSRALRQNAADPAARFGLGWAYHFKGWTDEALKQYETAIKSASDTAYLAYFNAGVIHQQKRQLEEAITSYQNAIALNPKGFGAVYNLAFIYSDRGQNDQALQQFAKAMKLEPRNPLVFYNAGLISERLSRKEDAKKFYQTAISLDNGLNPAKERLKALGG